MSVLKIKDENGKWVGVTSIKGEKGDKGDGAGTIHASQHFANGDDPIKPSDIGAATAGHTHTASEVGASPAVHNHDERYYTEGEVDTKLGTKAPAYTYGTTDVQAGSASPYANGTLHFVYE